MHPLAFHIYFKSNFEKLKQRRSLYTVPTYVWSIKTGVYEDTNTFFPIQMIQLPNMTPFTEVPYVYSTPCCLLKTTNTIGNWDIILPYNYLVKFLHYVVCCALMSTPRKIMNVFCGTCTYSQWIDASSSKLILHIKMLYGYIYNNPSWVAVF